MTDLAPAAPDTAPSTQLSPSVAPGNPSSFKPEAAEPKPEAPKPMSAREALEKAAADVKVDTGKPEAKPELKAEQPKPAAKAEAPSPKAEQPRENGRFAPTQEQPKPSDQSSEVKGTGQEGANDLRPSEGRGHEAPPARFLPRAKEQWANVPEDVKGEVHRALSEMEKGMSEYRESHEFRKELRQFEDMAKGANTTIPKVLSEYVEVFNQLRQNPASAVERLLQTVGITPQQYAQHVLGQAQQQQQNPALAHTQRLEQQIGQLQQQLQQMTQGTAQEREAARNAELERSVIAPFRAEHPRFDELQQDIVFFLNSDKIPSTLNERQRLETAYDMAERINPAPLQQSQARVSPATPERPINPAGEKSIKGSPLPGDGLPGSKGKMSTRDSVRAAMAELGISS